MSNIRYALASVKYHKKLSYFISLIFFTFLTLLTGILNLIDINTHSFLQIEKISPNSDYLLYHRELLNSYYFLFAIVVAFFILSFSILTFFSIQKKKQELFKWRLMGFSTPNILKQYLLETLFLLMIGAFFSAIFIIIFQHTYEATLMSCGELFNNLTNRHYSFFSTNTIIEATPNVLVNSDNVTYFFDIDLTRLPVIMIITALQKNIFLVFLLTLIISTFSLIVFLLINKRKSENL
ncbi:FtsX-like permease family protein [Enterococcus rivorum]|uniref:ABC3 transporter permease C-terminal domain-containing protein n=1 Tax=Enterococcus rivorum TaxID=762845 RepID=A0A1E5KWL5_9ENTE|nr:FtsX-like permease family protein [Enterococcus rivorum]MBP2100046.1 cell division protein FtsL [Enterococcus rivorum]OEH82242.1 hypothetical protein BCR26_13860 [Enterococcus rivorum]